MATLGNPYLTDSIAVGATIIRSILRAFFRLPAEMAKAVGKIHGV